VIGILLLSLIFAFTLGIHGRKWRPFLADWGRQVQQHNSALVGGVIFTWPIFSCPAIAFAGMSVHFRLGLALACVGVMVNYADRKRATPVVLPAWV